MAFVRPLKTRATGDAKRAEKKGSEEKSVESFANVRTSGPSGPTNPVARGGAGVERLTAGPFAFFLSIRVLYISLFLRCVLIRVYLLIRFPVHGKTYLPAESHR